MGPWRGHLHGGPAGRPPAVSQLLPAPALDLTGGIPRTGPRAPAYARGLDAFGPRRSRRAWLIARGVWFDVTRVVLQTSPSFLPRTGRRPQASRGRWRGRLSSRNSARAGPDRPGRRAARRPLAGYGSRTGPRSGA